MTPYLVSPYSPRPASEAAERAAMPARATRVAYQRAVFAGRDLVGQDAADYAAVCARSFGGQS